MKIFISNYIVSNNLEHIPHEIVKHQKLCRTYYTIGNLNFERLRDAKKYLGIKPVFSEEICKLDFNITNLENITSDCVVVK